MRSCPVHIAIALCAIVFSGDLAAHHSYSAYDITETTSVSGTVVRYRWTNPHVMLEVRDDSDRVWTIETESPAVMTTSGWSADSYKPGDVVTVRMNPARDGESATGLLLSVRGSDWVSRSSAARTGTPSALLTRATLVFALIIAAGIAVSYRRHRAPAAISMSAVGVGLLLWTLSFGYHMAAQYAGVALLIAGASWAGRASHRLADNS